MEQDSSLLEEPIKATWNSTTTDVGGALGTNTERNIGSAKEEISNDDLLLTIGGRLNLSEGWNIMGIPFDFPIDKNNVVVVCGGVNYGWYEALDMGIIIDCLYGWDPIAQSYLLSNIFEPGCPYWLYAYQDCTLLYSDTAFKGFMQESLRSPRLRPPSSP